MTRTHNSVASTGPDPVGELFELLKQRQDMVDAIAKRNINNLEVGVAYDVNTSKITLPAGMTLAEGAKQLNLMSAAEEKEVTASMTFKNWFWEDVLRSTKVVVERTFGFLNGQTIRSFFGDRPPIFVQVTTDVVDGVPIQEECFYGRISIGLWDDAKLEVSVHNGLAQINYTGMKRYKAQAVMLFDAILANLQQDSIYRGKAVIVDGTTSELSFEIAEIFENEHIKLNHQTDLMVNRMIKKNLLETGKRIYLFTGSYGNGKTETALSLGIFARKNGQSFFYIKKPQLLVPFLEKVKNYAPCLVFVEDIDEIASGAERTSQINNMLNTLDGVATKGTNFTVIFTTNHARNINPALRRPGRIDGFVEFNNPDLPTRTAIIESMLPNFLNYSAEEAAAIFEEDLSGATVAEIAKRALLNSENDVVDSEAFELAYASMGTQIRAMSEDLDQPAESAVFYENLSKVIAQSVLPVVRKNTSAKFHND